MIVTFKLTDKLIGKFRKPHSTNFYSIKGHIVKNKSENDNTNKIER